MEAFVGLRVPSKVKGLLLPKTSKTNQT